MFAHYGAFYYKGDSMIYKVKSLKDISVISSIFPQYVVDEASRIAEILDTNYNNYGMDGGYIVLIENERDTEELKRCIDYCSEPVELSRIIDDYISLLLLPATEYSISVIMPKIIYYGKEEEK